MSLEISEQPTASQGTPPTKNSVIPAPITILSFSHSNKPAMSDLNSSCLSAIGVKLSNGTAISPPEDTAHPLSAPPTLDGTHLSSQESPDSATASNAGPLDDVDPQIVEALKGKDRIYVLKLGEMMESLIDQRRQRIELTPITSYQRLLVHRCSAYYKLTLEADSMKTIHVFYTAESRIPTLRISELVPPETSTAPAFKIMRRSSTERRNKPSHQASSVTAEDGDLSDREQSETGSLGGRSNTTGGSAKKHMTIEEREAAYNEARSRIFMGFEEKEKVKDKDINSSSSSLSATSGSATNGESSAGDADSSSGSPATESEWSGPARRRQHSGYASASSSIRSSAYISNGSGSSRNSRAASPSSFQYPSLYEQTAAPAPLYDPAQQPAPTVPIYHPSYGYPSYNQSQPNPPYMPYPAYYPAPYPTYSVPPQPTQPGSDQSAQSNGEPYPPPPMPYPPPYIWSHPGQPPLQSPPMQPQHVPSQPPSNHPHAMNPPPPGQPPYQPYMAPPHTYPYPMTGYYPGQPVPPPGPPPMHHLAHMPNSQLYDPRIPNNGTGNGQTNGFRGGVPNSGVPPPVNGRPLPRNGYSTPPNNGGNAPRSRNGPTQPGRAPWSYGPGVGSGGFVGVVPQSSETVGPRLSNNRRQNNLSNSSTNGRSTSGDDSSSVTSSASSSSRKPQTMNTSSQHPLPPRPDWAINLMPQNSRNMSPISPPRNTSGGSVHSNSPRHPHSNLQNPSQSTDFPPLSTVQPLERRAPAGAWGNSSRPIFGQAPNNGTNNEMQSRFDESGFDRPPPKSAELYNPKTPKRAPLSTSNVENDKDQSGNEEVAAATSGLADQVAGLSLGNGTPAGSQP